MFTYNIEYRENILFMRFIGSLNKYTIKCIDEELNNIVYNMGIYNIVFNLEELEEIDLVATQTLIHWYNVINSRKGVSFICGMHDSVKSTDLLSYMDEISNELCAIRVINWNN